jgi:hypothetical protein
MVNIERDPLAGIADEDASTAAGTRTELFTAARRNFVRIRKDFVQHPKNPRPSVLADLVTARKERGLELLLTIHALQPILREAPLSLATWARLLDWPARRCTSRVIAAALHDLAGRELLQTSGSRLAPVLTLMRENGDASPWVEPGIDADRGRGYFAIPFELWTSGLMGRLRLPGKAMLLIILKETQNPNGPLTFTMPVERAPRWYGISERTAERGYLELRAQGLTVQKVQKIADATHPAGRREIYHRALLTPYSTDHREVLRLQAAAAAKVTERT